MKIELEMYSDEEDGSAVLQKLAELSTKAKELGFTVLEAEMETTAGEEYEEEEEGEDLDEEQER